MERGPVALFGAIVAVGLGPALWLGAQLGTVDLAPNERPSTVGEQFPDNDTGAELDFGGTGAGQTAENAEPVTRYTSAPVTSRPMRPDSEPVGSRRSALPSSSAPVPVSPSASVPSSQPPSAQPSASGSSTPPTESTEPTGEPEPSVDPTGGSGAGEEDPEPSPDEPQS